VAISRKKKARQAKTSQRPKRRPRQIMASPMAPISSAKWPGRAGNHSIFEMMNAKSVMTGPRRRDRCQSSAARACQAKRRADWAMRVGMAPTQRRSLAYLRPLSAFAASLTRCSAARMVLRKSRIKALPLGVRCTSTERRSEGSGLRRARS